MENCHAIDGKLDSNTPFASRYYHIQCCDFALQIQLFFFLSRLCEYAEILGFGGQGEPRENTSNWYPAASYTLASRLNIGLACARHEVISACAKGGQWQHAMSLYCALLGYRDLAKLLVESF